MAASTVARPSLTDSGRIVMPCGTSSAVFLPQESDVEPLVAEVKPAAA